MASLRINRTRRTRLVVKLSSYEKIRERLPMPLMRYENPNAHLRAVQDVRAHGFGEHAHRRRLKPSSNAL